MRDEYDFSKAKRVSEVPHLAKLQDVPAGKTRITIMLDNDVLAAFRDRAAASGKGYQTTINETLRAALEPATDPKLVDMIRGVALEEFARMLPVAFARVDQSLRVAQEEGHTVKPQPTPRKSPKRIAKSA